jgi:pumilio family protein 6
MIAKAYMKRHLKRNMKEEETIDELNPADEQPEEHDQEESNSVDMNSQYERKKAEKRHEKKKKGKELAMGHTQKKQRYLDVIQPAKMIWEKLRMKSNTASRENHVKDLLSILQGKFYEVLIKHDASRIVQSMLKYGNDGQRLIIGRELKGHYVELSKTKYGKFLIAKILKYCNTSLREMIITEFYGQIVKLIRHREASAIMNVVYRDFANTAQRSILMEEFYGPQFALFKTQERRTLEDLLAAFPEKKESVLKYMEDSLRAIINKGTLQYDMVHRALWQFFTYADLKRRTDMLELLKEYLVEILHTKEGICVAMQAMALGNAKDRKIMIKSMKSFMVKICKEEYGHMIMLRIFDSVDDIVLIEKYIVQKIKDHLLDIAMYKYGYRVLLYPFCHRSTKFLPPFLIEMLAADDDMASKTTKKSWDIKSIELRKVLSPLLIELCQHHAKSLITSRYTTEILVQTILHAEGNKQSLMASVASLAMEYDDIHSMIEHKIAHRTFKRLIKEEATGEFAKLLLSQIQPHIVALSQCKPASFVVLALLEHLATENHIFDILSGHISVLRQIDDPGTRLIVAHLV